MLERLGLVLLSIPAYVVLRLLGGFYGWVLTGFQMWDPWGGWYGGDWWMYPLTAIAFTPLFGGVLVVIVLGTNWVITGH